MNCIRYGRKQKENWGDFEEYKAQFSEIKESYDKMKGIKNKTDFAEVYNRVRDVVNRFES